MKKILFSTAILLLAVAPMANAQTPQEITNEVISAFENTASADFSNTTNVNISASGSAEGIDFDVSYNSGDIELLKSKNSFSYSSNAEKFSFKIDKEKSNTIEHGDLLFPMDLSGSYSRKFLADFDVFRFAGKFSYANVVVKNNPRLKNVIDGALEIAEPFTDKWIEVNIEELEKEFPELFEDFAEFKEEVSEELEDVNIAKEIQNTIAMGVDAGFITLTKNGHTYTLTANSPEGIAIFGATTPKIIITTKNGVVTQITIEGSVDTNLPKITVDASISISSRFTYNKPTITWPIFQKSDWEITKIVKMFLEFAKESEEISQQENKFWYDLENDIPAQDISATAKNYSSNIEVQNALEYLLNSEEKDEVKKFLKDYNNLDWKLRSRDIINIYNAKDKWITSYEKSNMKYIFTDSYYLSDKSYQQKEIASQAIEVISDEYRYYPWDITIDEEKVFKLDSRGDLIILWARVVQAEKLGE